MPELISHLAKSVKPMDLEDLKDRLDLARRALLQVDLRSPALNFAAGKRAPKIERSEGNPKAWTIASADRFVKRDLRIYNSKRELAIFTDFVAYSLDSRLENLVAPLRSIPAELSENGETAFETGSPVENRQLIDVLATHGITVSWTPAGCQLDRVTPRESASTSQAEPQAKLQDTRRIGRSRGITTGPARYLDHAVSPAVLENPLLRLFVEDTGRRPPEAALGPATLKATSLTPASERHDVVEASEPRPEAESSHRRDPASKRHDEVEASERRPEAEKPSSFALDPDQAEAVRLALSSEAMVIDGPPGTGKSQVIAAIAEHMIRSGRRAILTSTVPSALDVARRRIATIGGCHGQLLIDLPDDIAALEPPVIGEPDFDLLLIDESSRMPFDMALPLLTRARAVVLIGDDRQLRPDLPGETVLDRAASLGIQRTTLRYHYRSRDRSLISVSNILAYDMRLRAAPTPRINPSDGVRVVDMLTGRTSKLPGVPGSVNLEEAQAIIAKIASLRTDGDKRSVGIITANDSQRRLLTGWLKDMMPGPHEVEPLFVYSTQQAQGEERDIILVSTVYDGRDPSDRFGLFDQEGSVERLNVMLSRSRSEMWIYTSFRRSTPRAKTPPGRGRITYEGMRMLLDVMTEAINLLPVPTSIRESARRLGMQVDNLGIVFGFRYRTEDVYRAGLVVTNERQPQLHWSAIITQLKSLGWAIAVTTSADLQVRPVSPVDLVQAAMQRPTIQRPLP